MKDYRIKNRCFFKLFLTLLILILLFSSATAKTLLVDNPFKHFIENNKLKKNAKIIFFSIDANNDNLKDYFISCSDSKFSNGRLGKMYSVYFADKDKFIFNSSNCISLHYNRIIFIENENLKYRIPFAVMEKDSIWALSFENNIIKEEQIVNIKWGDFPLSPEIFNSLINHNSKSLHPLITLSYDDAINFKLTK